MANINFYFFDVLCSSSFYLYAEHFVAAEWNTTCYRIPDTSATACRKIAPLQHRTIISLVVK